ncbi:MAG: argininosuccinate lyase [Acidobacteria bacterium]|jgi:argininosuccinate lyase|nr:MAG: argininosuccinate lyase [Acidobacteriota bacterium]GIU81878.1 MAG: argininosuccinate lyase 2 [Pyrinomonadaceae bacterium]
MMRKEVLTEEKFPAEEYKETVLQENFEDAKRYFLEAYLQIDYAHAIMLFEQGIITKSEAKQLLKALKSIDLEKIRAIVYDGSFEDLFFLLQREIKNNCSDPDTAGKLHTARSRNDIDATLYRIKLREYLFETISAVIELRKVFLDLAESHQKTVIPAYTHTQPAQPTTLAHFLLAMVENLNRDTKRLIRAFENLNLCPLGSAAITTSGFPIDRFKTASLLGFDAPMRNSYGAIGAIDYFAEAISAIAVLMINIGRFAQEFLLMSMQEFGTLEISEGFVQGSSIMPQKRNPVALEHVRALASKAFGGAIGVLTAVHNTPFGDINDIEDDLQPLIFGVVKDANRSTRLFGAAMRSAKFNESLLKKRAGENFITVTELADEIVRRENLSFRLAHEIVGKAVRKSLELNSTLTIEILQESAEETIGKKLSLDSDELERILSPEHFVEIRKVYGGPAPEEVENSLSAEMQEVEKDKQWLRDKKEKLSRARTKLEEEVDSILKS